MKTESEKVMGLIFKTLKELIAKKRKSIPRTVSPIARGHQLTEFSGCIFEILTPAFFVNVLCKYRDVGIMGRFWGQDITIYILQLIYEEFDKKYEK